LAGSNGCAGRARFRDGNNQTSAGTMIAPAL